MGASEQERECRGEGGRGVSKSRPLSPLSLFLLDLVRLKHIYVVYVVWIPTNNNIYKLLMVNIKVCISLLIGVINFCIFLFDWINNLL